MRFKYILAFYLFLPSLLFAQPQINELRTKLEHTTDKAEKIDVYKHIIVFYSIKNPDSVDWYAAHAIEYANKQNYKPGEAKILGQLSVLDETQGRVNMAKEKAIDALKIYRDYNDLKGVAATLHNIGSIEASKGNYVVAIKYFIGSLKVYDTVTDNHGLLLTCTDLGNLYLQHRDTANAWKYFRIAEKTAEKVPPSDATVFLHNTIGVMYAESGNLDMALQTFLKALAESDKPGFVSSHVECLLYLGDFYLDKGNTEKALQYLRQGLATAKAANLPEMQSNILLELARIQEKTDPAAAMAYLNEAKALSISSHNKAFLAIVFDEIATELEHQGKYKDALIAFREKQKLTDSVYNIDKAKEIANISASYQLETNQRIRELQRLNEHNATQRDELILVASCLIALLVMVFFFYRKTRILNKQTILHEKQLEQDNAMKDKLFSVIGHDLRGPIARIPTILDMAEDEGTSAEERKYLFDNLREHTKASIETFDKLLFWGRSLVKGINLQQQKMLPQQYIAASMELRKIMAMEKTITITDNTPVDMIVYSDPSIFDFIIRNLMVNALKYTPRNGYITISPDIHSRPGFTVFAIKDSGKGISKGRMANIFYSLKSEQGTDNEEGHGIGLMLCKEFALQNGGDIWVESEEGKGATFYFSVKTNDHS